MKKVSQFILCSFYINKISLMGWIISLTGIVLTEYWVSVLGCQLLAGTLCGWQTFVCYTNLLHMQSLRGSISLFDKKVKMKTYCISCAYNAALKKIKTSQSV